MTRRMPDSLLNGDFHLGTMKMIFNMLEFIDGFVRFTDHGPILGNDSDSKARLFRKIMRQEIDFALIARDPKLWGDQFAGKHGVSFQIGPDPIHQIRGKANVHAKVNHKQQDDQQSGQTKKPFP